MGKLFLPLPYHYGCDFFFFGSKKSEDVVLRHLLNHSCARIKQNSRYSKRIEILSIFNFCSSSWLKRILQFYLLTFYYENIDPVLNIKTKHNKLLFLCCMLPTFIFLWSSFLIFYAWIELPSIYSINYCAVQQSCHGILFY